MLPDLRHPVDKPVTTFKEQEDRVDWVLQNFDNDELAMLYRHIHHRGIRYDGTEAAIRRLKSRFKP